MMRLVQKIGSGISVIGILLVALGGMKIRGGPDGTWIHVNPVHLAGGAAVVLGCFLSLIAAGGRNVAK